jgi:hypothetical protein
MFKKAMSESEARWKRTANLKGRILQILVNVNKLL